MSPILFAPHQIEPYPQERHEMLPIIGVQVKHRIRRNFFGRREEVMGDHLIMFGYLLFRPRKNGFILCIN